MSNSSSITHFLLLAFADTRELQLLHFCLFLGIYLAALLGNGLIIAAIACDHRLHTPMYFFLLNLSLLDLGSISTTLPKSMASSLWDTRTISYYGCAAQVSTFVLFVTGEFYLLTIMAYDRYVAICKPLHYGTLLGSRACAHMAAAAWGSGFLSAVLHTANTFSLPLCQGNAIDQFFCELPQILKLSCSDSYLREIFRAVLRIPSEQGRHKAFSTCLPHLAVVSLFVSTAMFAYLKPPSISSQSLNLVVAVLYSVVPPAVNPIIYSMRNKELKDSLRKLILWAALYPFILQSLSILGIALTHVQDLTLDLFGFPEVHMGLVLKPIWAYTCRDPCRPQSRVLCEALHGIQPGLTILKNFVPERHPSSEEMLVTAPCDPGKHKGSHLESLFIGPEIIDFCQMRGFNVGGTTEYRTAITSSKDGEEMEGGFRGDPQHGPEDLHIGEKNKKKTPKVHKDTNHKDPSLPEEGVGAGELEDLGKFTEELVYGIALAEW
ncbi:olfactory receptor 14C36-like [Grus japonensis]|uniref:Olfactory receptor 14C36-like n=1 Tax=Grus japonensis TaxID=30415 RepID=A0ABC9XWE7_GRUJA